MFYFRNRHHHWWTPIRRCEIEKYSSVPTWPVKMFARSQKYRIFGYSNIEFINKSAKEYQKLSLPKGRRFHVQFVLRQSNQSETLWYRSRVAVLRCFGWTNAVCWPLICERFIIMFQNVQIFFCLRRADLLSCFINELDIRFFFLLSRFINKLDIRRTFQLPVKMFARGRKNIFQFRFALL